MPFISCLFCSTSISIVILFPLGRSKPSSKIQQREAHLYTNIISSLSKLPRWTKNLCNHRETEKQNKKLKMETYMTGRRKRKRCLQPHLPLGSKTKTFYLFHKYPSANPSMYSHLHHKVFPTIPPPNILMGFLGLSPHSRVSIQGEKDTRQDFPSLFNNNKEANLLNQTKRVSMESEARARVKHQTLLQDYLDLQKEFVAKKKKLQITKQRRVTLLAEVRFLRRRRNQLLEMQSREEKDFVQLQSPEIQSKVQLTDNSNKVGEAVMKKLFPTVDSNLIPVGGIKIDGRKENILWEPSRLEKKPKNFLVNEKRFGKKKISWQDQVALEV